MGSAFSAGWRSAAGRALLGLRLGLGGSEFALQPLHLRVLVGEGARRFVELLPERQNSLLSRRARSPRERPFGGALFHRFNLPLEHGEPILLAAQRHRRVFLLLAKAGDHLQVGLCLFRQAPHVGFLHLPQALFDDLEPLPALIELRGEKRGRVFCARLPKLRVLFDESRGESIGDALGFFRRSAYIGDEERVGSGTRGRRQRLRKRDRRPASDRADRPVHSVTTQPFTSRDPLEHRPAQ